MMMFLKITSRQLALGSLFLLASACSFFSPSRHPAASSELTAVQIIEKLSLSADDLKADSKKNDPLIAKLKIKYDADPDSLEGALTPGGLHFKKIDPEIFNIPATVEPRIKSFLTVDELDSFKLDDAGLPQGVHAIENLNYEAQLEVINDLPKTRPLFARLVCDKPVRVNGKKSSLDFEFTIRHRKNPVVGNRRIIYPREDLSCTLYLKTHKKDSYQHGISIITESAIFKDLKLGKSIQEVCLHEPGKNLNSPYEFLASLSYQSMSCLHEAPKSELLKDPVEAFQTKMVALTGSRIPDEVLNSKNIDYNLDFSRAPKLDTILLAYLEYKADFSGHMVAKALKYHADQGAAVRIIVPQLPISPVLKKRDEALLKNLVKSNPNIQFKKMTYKHNGRLVLNSFHRVVHTKIFITLSNSNPESNLVIEGGRNIKDTFVFRSMPDYSSRPQMTQYGSEEPYTFMDDLEIMIKSRPIAVQTAAQLMSFYFRDDKNMKTRATSQHLGVLPKGASQHILEALNGKTHIRHFISVPFTDNKEMEDIFVDLIDSAQKSIHVASPYLRPREKLAKAFLRAVERGVKIKVITRLNLQGDNVPKVSQDIYRDSVNKFYQNFEIYSWEGNPELGDSILHTKAILVDEKLLYLGGVNINSRSFTHDVESGFLISGPKIPQEFLHLYNSYYLKHSVSINEKKSIGFFSKVVLLLLGPYF